MTRSRLDPNVEKFVLGCINSVEQLEILLLLMRLGTPMDVEAIAQELRTAITSAEKRLSDLMRKNLVSQHDVEGKKLFAYDPPEPLRGTIEHLSALYGTHRVSVINLIFSKPSDALTGFSDAFRFKE